MFCVIIDKSKLSSALFELQPFCHTLCHVQHSLHPLFGVSNALTTPVNKHKIRILNKLSQHIVSKDKSDDVSNKMTRPNVAVADT